MSAMHLARVPKVRALSTALPAVALLLCGCVVEVEPGPGAQKQVASTEQAIFQGTEIEPNNSGRVKFPGCSGTLLRNKWVLTASHCVNLHLDRDFNAAPLGGYVGSRPGVTINAATFDPQGRLILGGYIYDGLLARFYLQRFTAPGDVDNSFGTNGEVITDYVFSPLEMIDDLAVTADGKIVAAGWSFLGFTQVIALARYNADGSPDLGFGVLGQVQTDIPTSSGEAATSLAIDASGRAVIAGWSNTGGGVQVVVARYTTSGLLDNSFGNNGIVQTTVAPGVLSWGNDLALDPIGKIVVVGRALFFGLPEQGFVARYHTNGNLDSSFGGDGRTTLSTPSGQESRANAVAIQGGNVVVGGWLQDKGTVWRLTSGGSPSTSFGVGGRSQPIFARQIESEIVGMALTTGDEIRLGATVLTADGDYFGYTRIAANGATYQDQETWEAQGKSVWPGTAAALATSGERVVVAGTKVGTGATGGRAAFAALRPDRMEDTTFADPNDGIRLQMGDDGAAPGDNSFLVDKVYLDPNGEDVAVVHVPTGFMMNGSRTGYVGEPFYAGDPDALPGEDVVCQGYGNNEILPDGGITGFGTLREGLGRVSETTERFVGVGARPPPTVEQYTMSADSGSSCFYNGQNIGVLSRGFDKGGVYLRTDLPYIDWVNQLIQSP